MVTLERKAEEPAATTTPTQEQPPVETPPASSEAGPAAGEVVEEPAAEAGLTFELVEEEDPAASPTFELVEDAEQLEPALVGGEAGLELDEATVAALVTGAERAADAAVQRHLTKLTGRLD
jgi:hypothetical protein